jgi:translation initiation factor 3 subunit G
VSNLSENVAEADLQELFKPFGHIARIFLAKDKMSQQCKV